jgi:hypothetical protein
LKDIPAVGVAELLLTDNWAATPGLTLIELEVPEIEGAPASAAITVWLPEVFSVTEKVPVPLVSAELGGSTAWPSLLEKRTVPE